MLEEVKKDKQGNFMKLLKIKTNEIDDGKPEDQEEDEEYVDDYEMEKSEYEFTSEGEEEEEGYDGSSEGEGEEENGSYQEEEESDVKEKKN